MKKPLYIFSSGRLERRENTLSLETQEGRKVIPINSVSEIKVFGELDINKRALEFLTRNQIPVHFFNHYGYYIGSFYPRGALNSGFIILKQAEHYLDREKRMYLAKSFVAGAVNNILKNLEYYRRKGKDLKETISSIEEKFKAVSSVDSIAELMQVEGEIRKTYYESFNLIIQVEGFYFDKRTKRPPENPINALISFGNSLLYTTVLSEIYRTHLDPRIGYLHETNQRSFSLNLDISEVFKPVIVDRVMFSLLNKGQMQLKHFDSDVGFSYLNDKGRSIFVKEFEDKLNTTIKHRNLGNVSYRRLVRIECYKLYKHFMDEEIYKPFVGEW
ncbi:MAG: type I-B CRISPR-associated endonuclease Cas1b [Hydrogenobacter thermophilus]|uniref:type I-B CRISPR-associated endonuclease Cas1b n=1 Tax=Hydrogenobacter thermophilus TaxID=940 RepID=UPI001C74934E|nr:type I-B CRISPR-associated endonuclease Cas1b [Hydrogenobacter thermophilus]MCS7284568.1 type I-B CRISPR-associated endonuclease Cas1b [Hydrogenobacter thermophilus]QWK20550.1 MAG: type I-B CRISPR-associated endonuclease Cas1b [Hydrogenobacter thermophilus]